MTLTKRLFATAHIGALAVTGFLAATSGASAQAAGVYSGAQAERGATLFTQRCGACHGEEMVDTFKHYPTAGAFFGFVASEMPMDNPGGLPPQEYADIVAYLLHGAGFPEGGSDLAPDLAVLNGVVPGAPGN